MKLTRDFSIDKKLNKVAEMLDHIVYYGKQGNFFVAQGFGGKRSKPDFYYLYKTEEGMLKKVISYLELAKSRKKSKEEQKQKRADDRKKLMEEIKPGSILYATWGYEQTNVDFYKVLEVKGTKVTLIELSHKSVEGSEYSHGMACNVVAGSPLDKEPVTLTIGSYGVKVCSSVTLRPWDGKQVYKSWYY